jgi:methionyl-tRNA formyltransferase
VGAALRVVFLATAEFAVPTLRALSQGPDGIEAVVTRPDRPAGRGRRLRPPPAKTAAERLGLAVHQPAHVSGPDGLQLLEGLAPDVLFVVAFGGILSPKALAVPRLAAVNVHASLLPRHRGAAPIQRALLAGDTETGVTIQWMAAEMDAGDIILQRRLAVGGEDDFGALHDRLAHLGAEAALAVLDLLRAGKAPRCPQQAAGVTYAPPIRREELVLDWRRSAAEIVRAVRAFSPRPGARTTHQGKLLKLLAARDEPGGARDRGVPGEVTELTGEGFLVGAGEGRVAVLRVQPEGGRAMLAAEYARGHGLALGHRLGGG